MKFPCALKNALLIIRDRFVMSFAIKGLGYLAALYLLLPLLVCYKLLLSNYLLLTISVLAKNTLLKTACYLPLLLVGFYTLSYRKDYDRSPMLVRGLIVNRRFVQVRTTPKHQSTHISNYQSSQHKSSQHGESD